MIKLLVLILLIPGLSFSQLNEEKYFGDNPGNLRMMSFTSGVNDSEKRPLVIALHGCTQNANSMSQQSGWNILAQKHHFVVIYPQQKRANNGSNCFNWFKSEDNNGPYGELESIKNMIDFAIQNYNIDTSRVFIYGLSAGAAMSVSLMANYPEIFKAGASFAGAPHNIVQNYSEASKAMKGKINRTPEEWGLLMPDQPNNINYPKLLIFHGDKDVIVSKSNANELIKQWSFLHKIDTVSDQLKAGFAANTKITRVSYEDSNNIEQIVYYKIKDLGHAIPIDPGRGKKEGGKQSAFSKDIDFFSTYYVAKDFGLIECKTQSPLKGD